MHLSPDWIRAAIGGALIGISATLMLAFNGRVTGISGIVGGVVHPSPGDVAWRALFLVGLVLGGLAVYAVTPAAFAAPAVKLGTAALAGVFVGVGTRLGNGCTSGHGVCGLSRFSVRSLVATLTFITTGAVTVALTGGAR